MLCSIKGNSALTMALGAGLLLGAWAGGAAAQVVADDVQCSQCVGKGDILDKAVTARKIKGNSVFSSKIVNRSILGIDIGLGAVGTDEIADDSVTLDKLAPEVRDLLGGAGGGGIIVTQDVFMVANGTAFSIGAGVFTPSTETRAIMAAPRDGILANLFVVPNLAPATSSLVTVTVRVESTDTDLSVVHTDANGTNTVANTIDTVAVNQGDLITVKFVESGGVSTGTNYRASFEFQ